MRRHTGADAHPGGRNNGVASAAGEWVAEGGVIFHCAMLACQRRLPARRGEWIWGLRANGTSPEASWAQLLGQERVILLTASPGCLGRSWLRRVVTGWAVESGGLCSNPSSATY